jgi:hypothetical protein
MTDTTLKETMLDDALRMIDEQRAHFVGLNGPERAVESEMWFRKQIAQALAPLIARIERLERKPAPAATSKPPKEFISAIGQIIADELKERDARIAKLEQRGWRGDYQRALAYPMQSEVRHKHATWIAICDIAPGEIPGEGATGWQQKDKPQTPPRQPTVQRSNGPVMS